MKWLPTYLLFCFAALGEPVTLAWNPNPIEDAVAFYTVYWGQSSHNYSDCADTALTSLPIKLTAGRWYFMVTASNGVLVSDPSEEISYLSTDTAPVVVNIAIQWAASMIGPWTNLAAYTLTNPTAGFWRLAGERTQ